MITHLFADGGRIIASRKTGYAEHVGANDMPSIVKRLMQEQHKAMFIELRDCVYDDLPDGAGPMVSAPPGKAAQPASSATSTSATQAQAAAPAQPAKVAAKPGAPAATAPARAVPNRPLSVPIQLARPSLIPGAAKPAGAPAPAGAAAAAATSAGAGSAAKSASMPAGAARGAPAQGAGNVSKPAANSAPLGAMGTASRTAVPVPAPKFVGTPPPMVAPSRLQMQLDTEALDRAAEALLLSSSFGRARGETVRRGAGRYQQTVAAKQRPQRTPTGRTGFVGEALRGKSLDEVILSYLSDDAGDGER